MLLILKYIRIIKKSSCPGLQVSVHFVRIGFAVRQVVPTVYKIRLQNFQFTMKTFAEISKKTVSRLPVIKPTCGLEILVSATLQKN